MDAYDAANPEFGTMTNEFYADLLGNPAPEGSMDVPDEEPPAEVPEEDETLNSDLQDFPFDDDCPMEDTANATANADKAQNAEPEKVTEHLTESFVKTVSAMAHGRQLVLTQSGQDSSDSFAPAFQNYMFWVKKTITTTGARTPNQLEYIALSFLHPEAEKQVLLALGNEVSYDKVIRYLESLVKGLGHGPVQITLNIIKYDILEAGVFSANKHNNVIPDVGYELGNFQRLLSQREPLDDVTHCALILHIFRNVSAIVGQVKRITVDGVTVEQSNPDNLKAEIIARDSDYKAAVARALKGKQQVFPNNKRPYNSGEGTSSQQQQQSKQQRKFPPPKGKQNQASPFGENYNPFLDSKAKRAVAPIDRTSKCWVKGVNSQEKKARKEAGSCYICNQPVTSTHKMHNCPKSQTLFDKKEFCWYNK